MENQEYTIYAHVIHSIVVKAESEDEAIEKAKNLPLIDWQAEKMTDFDAYVGNVQ